MASIPTTLMASKVQIMENKGQNMGIENIAARR